MAWVSEKQVFVSDWVAGRNAELNTDTSSVWWPSAEDSTDSFLTPSINVLSAAAPDPDTTTLPSPPSTWMQVPQAGTPPGSRFGSTLADHETAAVTTASGRQARGSWCLVWCDERCHKQENEESRQQLASAAREIGGSFICRRKAAKYIAWLNYGPPPPYVLLASWREVKPCVAALTEQGNSRNPALLVILAENRRVYDKACLWATCVEQEMTTGFKVLVVQDLGSLALKGLVKGEIANTLAVSGVLKVGMRTNPGSMRHLPVPKVSQMTSAPLLPRSVPPSSSAIGPNPNPSPTPPRVFARLSRQLTAFAHEPLELQRLPFQHQQWAPQQQQQPEQDSKVNQRQHHAPVYSSSGGWSSTEMSDNYSSDEESGAPGFQLHTLTVNLERILVDALK
mmetsp:Transcript_16196/g.35544  ORF Transcript_16196/g.35544 Transcript_16196/m.35544 type:complete len:395 (-) Transcript_16196:68-1252(-)|eukprot:CAMPEP_0206621620 /NCGR_PEP_ID=MMETSP0325_2-20121206/62311_1 /ASSEMBLY_ACC=CAM_ASM_000347 /TAXON_ID=2866 /ORGANISM="Crypthecodinium cohnii, Strain Seligo" /LENGTH=394 /DNA_ID=CAMNT_0054144773 /DNA_START=49 /DNA_END=1233 /DNA_ORIENTATION=+